MSTSVRHRWPLVLGISLEGLVKGVGNVGGDVAKGVGDSLGKIFGK